MKQWFCLNIEEVAVACFTQKLFSGQMHAIYISKHTYQGYHPLKKVASKNKVVNFFFRRNMLTTMIIIINDDISWLASEKIRQFKVVMVHTHVVSPGFTYSLYIFHRLVFHVAPQICHSRKAEPTKVQMLCDSDSFSKKYINNKKNHIQHEICQQKYFSIKYIGKPDITFFFDKQPQETCTHTPPHHQQTGWSHINDALHIHWLLSPVQLSPPSLHSFFWKIIFFLFHVKK